MGPFFDSRKFLRTPGFAPDGLYDDEPSSPRELPPPPPEYRPMPPRQPQAEYDMPQQRGMSGMLEDAPMARPQREYGEIPQPRQQRMELPEPPIPPKVGLTRKILGTVASMYVPQVGREILAPGYDRQVREYRGKMATLKAQSDLDYKAAQSQAQMATAEYRAAQKKAEEARAGSYGGRLHNVSPGQVAVNADGKPVYTAPPLPPKPEAPGVRIGRDGRPYMEEGEKFVTLPPNVAMASVNTAPRKPSVFVVLEEAVNKEMPTATEEEKNKEVLKRFNATEALKAEKARADIDKARRAPATRSGGNLTPNQANAEARRKLQEETDAFIGQSGGLEKAIADINAWPQRDARAEEIRQRLLAIQGEQARKNKKGGKPDFRSVLGAGGEKAPAAAAPATPAAPPKNSAPAVGTVKSGYRFKGGDPASPSSWEKVK